MKRIIALKLNRDKNGFTLVELIVILVVLGILAAILIPSFVGYIDTAQANRCRTNRENLDTMLYSIVDVYYWANLTKENVLTDNIADAKVKAKVEGLVNPDDFACPTGGTIYYEKGILKCTKHSEAETFAGAVYDHLGYLMESPKVMEYFKSRDNQELDSTGENFGIPTKEYMKAYLKKECNLDGDFDFLIYRNSKDTPPYQIFLFDSVNGKAVGDTVEVIKVNWDPTKGAISSENGTAPLKKKELTKQYLVIDRNSFKANDS